MIIDTIFSFFLLILIILTVFVQFDFSISKKIRSIDKIILLPYWTFFAPNPMIYDFKILFISRDSNELEIENWNEVDLKYGRKWYHFIWNPHKKYSKACIDIIQSIISQSQELNENQILLTIPYLSLSNFIENYIIETNLKNQKNGFQYLILKDSGYDIEESFSIVFRSAYHPYSS